MEDFSKLEIDNLPKTEEVTSVPATLSVSGIEIPLKGTGDPFK